MLLDALPEASRAVFVEALGRIASIGPGGGGSGQSRSLLAAE